MDKMIIERSLPVTGMTMGTPTPAENDLGLRLDRTGRLWDGEKKPELRMLNNYGLLEVLDGNGSFYSPLTGWRDIKPGTGIWLFPDIPHFYQAQIRWQTRWIVFNGSLADHFRTIGYLVPEAPLIKGCHDIVEESFQSLKRNNDAREKVAAMTNFDALVRLISGLFQCQHSAGIQESNPLAEIKHFIRENCTSSLTPEKVARQFGISYSHLRRLFREEVGMGLKQYITSERMKTAKTLLIDTDIPSKQAAAAVGYDDYLYFMRLFRKYTGLSVGEYRNRKLLFPPAACSLTAGGSSGHTDPERTD